MKKIFGVLRFVASVIVSGISAAVIIPILPFDRDHTLFHRITRTWARALIYICGIHVDLKGVEWLQQSQHYIYVSNHASLVDIPVMLATIPDRIHILYKKELELIPLFGWGLKGGPHIPIDRRQTHESRRSLVAAMQKIRDGASVLLYAEGTRTIDGTLQPFKRGAFYIAAQTGVPVLPLTVNGSFGVLPKGSFSIMPGTIELILEKPLNLGGEYGKGEELNLMEQVHKAIEKHHHT